MPNNYQHVYDAIKKAREDGTAWVTWFGERLKIARVEFTGGIPHLPEGLTVPSVGYGHMDPKNDLNWWIGEALVKARRRGGIAQAECNAYKDCGGRIRIYEWSNEGGEAGRSRGVVRMIGWRDILAVIVERHARSDADGAGD